MVSWLVLRRSLIFLLRLDAWMLGGFSGHSHVLMKFTIFFCVICAVKTTCIHVDYD
jgi:hypothetical protein